jgi:hypothetical protein
MHKKELRELLCAMLLGDASMYINNTARHTSGSFWIEHSSKQEDYLLWKAFLIDSIFEKKSLNRRCRIYRRDRIDKRTGNTYHSILLCLNWKSYFSFLHKKAYRYKDGKIHKNLEFLLNSVSSDKHLAIWMMDDSSESKAKAKHVDGDVYYKNPYFRLAAYCFTDGECQLIKEWFNRKYKVNPSINQYKHGPVLQFNVADTKKLFPHIRPYIVQFDSMKKKFSLCIARY